MSSRNTSHRDPSIQSLSQPVKPLLKSRSIASWCPQGFLIILTVIFCLGIFVAMIEFGMVAKANFTDYDINIKSMNYEVSGTLYGFSLPTLIHIYWTSKAHCNAIIVAALSIAWPFVYGAILIHVFLIKVKPKNRKYRTLLLFILVETGKWANMEPFCTAYFALVSYSETKTPVLEYSITSGPSNESCLYIGLTIVFVIFAMVLLAMDQYFTYQDDEDGKHGYHALEEEKPKSILENDSVLQYSDDKWYCLLFANEQKSMVNIALYSLYLTALVCSVWIIIQSLWIAQVGFHLNGFTGMGSPDLVLSAKQIGMTLGDYLNLKNSMSHFLIMIFLAYVVIVPLIVQCLLVFVWFVPMRNWMIRLVIRNIFLCQAQNCMGIYFIASLLSFEMKYYSKWITAFKELPGLCDDTTIIYNNVDGGCFEAVAFFNDNGIVLMMFGWFIQWTTLIYTLKVANNLGLKVIRFG